jgi:hypothetical protein
MPAQDPAKPATEQPTEPAEQPTSEPARKRAAKKVVAPEPAPQPDVDRDTWVKAHGNVRHRMAAVARRVTAVDKNQRNVDQKYSFRGIDDFLNSLHPLLAEFEVGVEPRYKRTDRFERATRSGGTMTYVILEGNITFTAPDGSKVKVRTYGEGADTADKATNKAMTACLKYALIQTFTVPTKDMDDGDRTTIEQAPMPTRAELMARLDKVGSKLGMPREDLTQKWRDKHGGITLEAFEALEPEVLLPFVVASEQHADVALDQQSAGGGYS